MNEVWYVYLIQVVKLAHIFSVSKM